MSKIKDKKIIEEIVKDKQKLLVKNTTIKK